MGFTASRGMWAFGLRIRGSLAEQVSHSLSCVEGLGRRV